jgi:signal transduction histidine kinase
MNAPVCPFPFLARARRGWSRLGLDGRYAVASLPVLVVAMLSLGSWVTNSISFEVIENTALNASVFVDSAVSRELQGLASRGQLTAEETGRLNGLLTDTPLGRRVLSFKVWVPGGRVTYSSRAPETVGRVFEPSPRLREAWNGSVAAELMPREKAESHAEHGLGVPLLEVYMPVRAQGTQKVIAVAEFYQDASELQEDLASTRSRTWAMVAAVMLAMYGLLFAIVHAGGRLIRSQAGLLNQKVTELSELLAQNEALRARVGRATRRITEMNEAFLRRLAADLHDGPAQALSLALLRLDHIKGTRPQVAPASLPPGDGTVGRTMDELDQIRGTLQEAMQEIRQLSRGLSLPELAGLSMGEVVERAAATHMRRTRTQVALDLDDLDALHGVSMPVKLTAYRFAQEALTNAFRHAEGRGQAVGARRVGNSVEICVSDEGPGMRGELEDQLSDRMGLVGLRERVEVLGGSFRIDSRPGVGTSLTALLPVE